TNQSQYVTRAEAAHLIGVTVDAISYRIKTGELTSKPDPGDRRRVIINRTEVEALAQRLAAGREPQPQ
ncbi:TPA: hypothetical protein I8V72_002682, partial [Corynebacterium striatum]|nr:hypothetical protein [Corynebacterium striatum]